MISIEDIYKSLINKVISDGSLIIISDKLSQLKRNSEMVKYATTLLEEHKLMPELIKVKKCSNKADIYRQKGNDYFAKKCDIQSLQYYNLSLLFAQLESDQLAIAYANRSAVLFSMQSYSEALDDINRVLKMKYPEKIKSKLQHRKQQCEEKLRAIRSINAKVESKIYNQIQYGQVYECASDCIEVLYDEHFGRHVVAKRDIAVGEVICIESPYTSVLSFSEFLFRCSQCLQRFGNLNPCPFCCYTMYCSDKCASSAWQEYHKVECPMMASMYSLQLTILEHLSLRIVLKAFSTLGLGKLTKICKNYEASKLAEYNGCVQQANGKLIYNSKHYESIHALESNVDQRSESDILGKALAAAIFAKLLGTNDNILCSLLLHHCMTVPTNSHSLSILAFDKEGVEQTRIEYGGAAFAFIPLLNHSCAPNIVRIQPAFTTLEGKRRRDMLADVAILPIKKGEQLLDNYGYRFVLMDLKSRKAILKDQYKFECACLACKNNWPMGSQLKELDNQQYNLHKKALMALDETVCALRAGKMDGTLENSTGKLSHLITTLSHLKPHESPPSTELADAQELLKKTLEAIAGVEPYEFTKHLTRDQIDM